VMGRSFGLIPRALMREASVVGFMPNKSAAPRDPKELPHIAGPIVRGELAYRGLRHSRRGTTHSPRALLQEMGGERRDIGAALAQRRDLNREDAQSIKKGLASNIPSGGVSRI